MLKCTDCNLWFHDHEVEEGSCLGCKEPWLEDVPQGVDLPDGPPGYISLLEKLEVRPTRHEVLLPFQHDPKNYYVAAVVYEGEGRYWYIEGRSQKFKDVKDAILEVVVTVDAKRTQMLADEFNKAFGGMDDEA